MGKEERGGGGREEDRLSNRKSSKSVSGKVRVKTVRVQKTIQRQDGTNRDKDTGVNTDRKGESKERPSRKIEKGDLKRYSDGKW